MLSLRIIDDGQMKYLIFVLCSHSLQGDIRKLNHDMKYHNAFFSCFVMQVV